MNNWKLDPSLDLDDILCTLFFHAEGCSCSYTENIKSSKIAATIFIHLLKRHMNWKKLHGRAARFLYFCWIGSNPPPPQAITQYTYHPFSCLSSLCVARKACKPGRRRGGGDGTYLKRQQRCVGLLQYKIPHTFWFFSNSAVASPCIPLVLAAYLKEGHRYPHTPTPNRDRFDLHAALFNV